jgi:hypothetical protein
MSRKATSKPQVERELDDINGEQIDDIVFSALTHPEKEEHAEQT